MINIPYQSPEELTPEVPTLRDMSVEYLKSSWYTSLSPRVKDDYRRWIELLTKTKNGTLYLDEVSRKMAKSFHEAIATQGNPHDADKFAMVWRRIYNLAIDSDYVRENPFSNMRVAKAKPREVVWAQEQVQNVIKSAIVLGFENVARTVCLCYDTAQRPGDVYKFRRSMIHKDANGYYIEFNQNKTGKQVRPALSDFTVDLLGISEEWLKWDLNIVTGREDFDHNDRRTINTRFREIKDLLDIEDDIQIRDLRRTAITEMGAASDDHIMSASGHVNRNQLNTYSLRSREKALQAQQTRQSFLSKGKQDGT